MATPKSVVTEMLEFAGDEMPQRWKEKWQSMDSTWTGVKVENILQKWLEATYYDGVRREDLTREDIVKVGALIQSLLRFEPSTRASAQEVLQDPWFQDEQTDHVSCVAHGVIT
jgi:serine/threonine-protein kinase SRPK3